MQLILVGIVTHFFSKRIGKDADSITHYHLMTALSKTPSCCPRRLGASSPPRGSLAWTPSHFTSRSESPAFPQVQAGCSHQAWRAALSRPSAWEQRAGRLGWGPSSSPAKAGEEGGEAGSGFSTPAVLLLLSSPTRGALAPAAAGKRALAVTGR